MTLRRKCNGAKYVTEALNSCIAGLVGERSSRAEGELKSLLDCGEVIMLT